MESQIGIIARVWGFFTFANTLWILAIIGSKIENFLISAIFFFITLEKVNNKIKFY